MSGMSKQAESCWAELKMDDELRAGYATRLDMTKRALAVL